MKKHFQLPAAWDRLGQTFRSANGTGASPGQRQPSAQSVAAECSHVRLLGSENLNCWQSQPLNYQLVQSIGGKKKRQRITYPQTGRK